MEIGTLAPIEVVRAQSTVAADQQTLTVALTNLQLQQLLMKNAVSRTLVDPMLADADVIPTSTMQLPAQEPIVPIQDLVNDALSHRPDLAEARISLTNTAISNKAIRSGLLPTVDLFAYYGGQGLGGQQNPSNLCLNETPDEQLGGFCAGPDPALAVPPNPPPTLIKIAPTTSYGGTLNQLVNSTAPDKGAGITIKSRYAIAMRSRSRCVARWSIGSRSCVFSRLKTRYASRCATRSLACNRIGPAWIPLKPLSIWPASL